MKNLNLKKNKKGFVGTALLIAIFVIAAVIVIFLALGKNDNIVYKSTTSNSGNTKIIAKNEDILDADGTGVSCELLTAEEDKFQSNIVMIRDAAKSYFTVNRMPSKVGDSIKLTLKEMQDSKMVLTIKDNLGNVCDDEKSYVEVTKSDTEYLMKVNLSCGDMEDYILVNIGCYDFCNNSCNTIVTKEYEYEYKKTIACTPTEWSAWTNWSTKKEATNSNKKEDVKTEKKQEEIIDTVDATKGATTYNCDKYPGYKLSGTKCVKTTTKTDVIDATYSDITYNCDKYPGYTLNGKYCEKKIEETKTYDADANPATYNCDKYPGYKLSGTKCIKTITKTDTVDAEIEYSCASDYKLSGTKCIKTITRTDTVSATPVYGSRNINVDYPCNEQKCTTKTVMDCSNGCSMVPQTSCETIKKTCSKTVTQQYVSGYKCDNDYKLSGTKCTKTITETDTQTAKKTYVCASDYKLDGTKCVKTTKTNDTKNATKDPTTYNCNKYNDATLNGNKCIIKTTKTDTKNATVSGGGYVCKTGYKLSGTKCSKEITNTDTKNASAVEGKYSCNTGYTLNGTKCTKKTVKTIEIKYYRYATRSCIGGSSDIKWSKNSNDKTLIDSGYVKTGNKKLITK